MIKVLHGDITEVIAKIPDASFDCIIADPPYGETSLDWDRRVPGWPALLRRVLKPSGSMWVFGSLRLFTETMSEFADYRIAQDIVWEKHNGSNAFNDRFRRVHEIAVHLYPKDARWSDIFKEPQFTNDATAKTIRRKQRTPQWGVIDASSYSSYRSEDGGPRLMRSVIPVRSEHGRAEHPTQKPWGIIEPLLRYSCPAGGRVLDPFAGSGTTGIVARALGMEATLVEHNPEFVDLISRRILEDAPLVASMSVAPERPTQGVLV